MKQPEFCVKALCQLKDSFINEILFSSCKYLETRSLLDFLQEALLFCSRFTGIAMITQKWLLSFERVRTKGTGNFEISSSFVEFSKFRQIIFFKCLLGGHG